MAPRVILAEEDTEGYITATVRFDDGFDQTVRLPAWATKENLKDEAERLRSEAQAALANKQERTDLVG